MRNMILVLGDQLDRNSAAFDDFDSENDAVWMAEVEEEATHVWAHKLRIAYFFSAMRHFRDELRERDVEVHYHELGTRRSDDRGNDFATVLRKEVNNLRPERLIVVHPGDWRVKESLQETADKLGIELEIRPDRHFYCEPEAFQKFAKRRKSLLLETFYREMRKKHDVLMEDGQPVGDKWNYDHDNRETFGSDGPGKFTEPRSFQPDELTNQVCEMVEQRYKKHPGTLEYFDLPVTRSQALAMLRAFLDRGLPNFGTYEDAMWRDEAFLYHSRLSVPLNLKLLNPRECVEKAVAAYYAGDAPINSVEGFVRQILGWREFIRGVYWLHMPDYADKNHYAHSDDVPSFYWDGETDMQCVRQSMQHVVRYAYSHHIHRLMVLGNFALLLGVDPKRFHQWHMAMYADAIDWVSLPNALGMSQHGDGGIVGTKPYISSGNYVNRMSNFCRHCRYDYREATGDDACPITTMYWNFLDRHEKKLEGNHRMTMQLKNLERKRSSGELPEIRKRAEKLRDEMLPAK